MTTSAYHAAKSWLGWLVGGIVVVVAIAALSVDEPAPSASATNDVVAAAPQPPKTYVVRSVTDGDTLLLRNGDSVRLVGIDAPENGVCGAERATQLLTRLVGGKRVTLTAPVDDRDRYDRILRYVDIGDTDAGLRMIGSGLAIARYDSRDGYDHHSRQRSYVRLDRSTPNVRCAPA